MNLSLRSRPHHQLRGELLLWRAGGVVVAVLAVLGVLQAILWSLIAPGEQFVVYADGTYLPLPTASYHQFTSIAIFCLVGLVVAVSSATLIWHWRSVRGTAMVLVVAGANAVGALVAYLVGRILVSGVDPASVGPSAASSLVNAAPTLGNAMVLLVQPGLAVVVYTFLIAWNGDPDLGRVTPPPEA
ncbi:Protein of unknown function [Nakamurella panacisegetis]|uniref:DUF2567 domain-containing protein n=1 Tax=Nakamurella panacisegetis TaxID=1090615 RepID=A0A1H0R416_9ACTN|nr:DUF2567 domain-containing protein [Nakamurella panacisegetis]SDP24227.1 Protein of unknown function [Nakamurella panacisegetis]